MQTEPAPDYSFLDDTGKTSKRSLFGGGDNKTRLLMMVAAGGILLVAILGIIVVLFSGSSNTENLVGIVAEQTELIRTSEIGEKDASSAETKNYASTVNLSLISAENKLSTYVENEGRKLKGEDKSGAKNADTDKALTTASQVNNFDVVFGETIKTSLQEYQKSLNDAYNASTSKSEKAILQEMYASAKVLVETVPIN